MLRYHDARLQPTIRDVIMQMIITSDNTATDIAIARVGGVAAVNEWLRPTAIAGLKLNSTILEVFRNRYTWRTRSASLSAEDVYALGSGDLAYGTSPRRGSRPSRPACGSRRSRRTRTSGAFRGAVHLAGRDHAARRRAHAGSHRAREAGLREEHRGDEGRVFRRQQSGSRRLPHFIDVPVGHKTGDFPPVVANDVGVIYARSGPVVVSFLLNAIREPYGEAEDRMGEVARRIVEYFDGEK